MFSFIPWRTTLPGSAAAMRACSATDKSGAGNKLSPPGYERKAVPFLTSLSFSARHGYGAPHDGTLPAFEYGNRSPNG
jgi:hypothetical protein